MLLIDCPFCGTRPELEFHCGGEAHIKRPERPGDLDDEEWAAFLFYRSNTKGLQAERWHHSHGCQRWFNALRNTVTDDIEATYRMGQARPDLAEVTTQPGSVDGTAGDLVRVMADAGGERP